MRLKLFVFGLVCFFTTSVSAQKYSTKNGIINFEASVPSFEEVKANNQNVSAILNAETGEFASLALIKGFRFKVALMEEHFNENYMESSKYPKAIVKGKLNDFSLGLISESATTFILEGTITMHGVTNSFSTEVSLSKDNNIINLTSNFVLKPEDFNIEIPKIVSNKIADTVNVSVQYSLDN